MNLWAKSLRQLLVSAVALFFFSCEDESGIIGYPNPNKKFNVSYLEIPLESTVVLLDSLITDNGDGAGTVLAGEYFDPVMGNIRTQPFLQVSPTTTTKLDATAEYDSASIQVRLNFYVYGFASNETFTFSVRSIIDDLTFSNSNRYYHNSAVNYGTIELAQLKGFVNYDSVKAQSGKTTPDTVLLRGTMDYDYGKTLFTIARDNPDSALHYFERFKTTVKGLTLVPTEANGVIGLTLSSSLSKLVIHYHTKEASGAVKDTLERAFVFANSALANTSFTQIINDRSGTELAAAVPYQGFDAAMRYVQSGSPVITKVDLTNFYNFADTVDNLLINSAELVIEGVNTEEATRAHSLLLMRIMNADDRFISRKNDTDSVEMRNYYVSADGNLYNVYSDRQESTTTPASIAYDDETGSMSGFFTLFAQTLFKYKNDEDGINDNRIKYLGLFPYSPDMPRSVTRTIFDKNKVKLRINYTRPTDLKP
jgi:hypothetical protein